MKYYLKFKILIKNAFENIACEMATIYSSFNVLKTHAEYDP